MKKFILSIGIATLFVFALIGISTPVAAYSPSAAVN